LVCGCALRTENLEGVAAGHGHAPHAMHWRQAGNGLQRLVCARYALPTVLLELAQDLAPLRTAAVLHRPREVDQGRVVRIGVTAQAGALGVVVMRHGVALRR